MQLSKTLVAAIFAASTAFAAPTEEAKSMTANVPQWTIEGMKRTCTKDNSHCTWSFNINTHVAGAKPTDCKHEVAGPHVKASPASHCGDYTVTSGWSDQFGPGNGFTTLAVVDNKKKLIAWPAYRDQQVEGGKVVKPDQSYAVTTLG